jgi:hypothetical protein
MHETFPVIPGNIEQVKMSRQYWKQFPVIIEIKPPGPKGIGSRRMKRFPLLLWKKYSGTVSSHLRK